MSAPTPYDRSPRHRRWLDVMRAAAAVLVLLSHARDFTLRDAAAQPALSIIGRAFFAVSGLGHQAVIVFFVLSGFLVTESMRRRAAAGEWSLLRFGVDRLSRLWLVLIPCLLVGGVLDAIGMALAGQGDLDYGALAVTAPRAAPALDAATLLGNLMFLQTVTVPVFGSNGPLWSLADEAWFYALAALAFAAWQARRTPLAAAVPLVAMITTLLWLPSTIVQFFPVWLCGAVCSGLLFAKGATSTAHAAAASLCVAALLAVSRLKLAASPLAMDLALGLGTAWLIAAVVDLPWRDRWWSRPVLALSGMSYTLYVSHVPLLALLSTILVGPHRGVLDQRSATVMLLETTAALAFAAGLWWMFERHTPVVRRHLARVLSTRPAMGGVAARGPAS